VWRTVRRLPPFVGGFFAVVLVLAVATGGYLLTWRLRDTSDHVPAASTPSLVTAATVTPSVPPAHSWPAPVPARVQAALASALADPRLGGRVLAEISDGASGTVLFDRAAATAAPPASTAKLATAVALLSVRPVPARITTRVVAAAQPGTVVLVGGGDPTLSAALAGQATPYQNAARISDLADQVRRTGLTINHVTVDDSLFPGPAISPAWGPGDAPSSYAAPITAVMVDGGRDEPTAIGRSADPAIAAGRALARFLRVPADAVTRGRAPSNARVLATVQSAPFGDLVGQMLQQSDNVIAECLARQVAVARGLPPSFDGAVTAVGTVLAADGVPIDGKLFDGSGLASTDRLAPSTLVELLDLAAFGPRSEERTVIDDLPVAAWSGTLADRYHGSAGAGFVRAKTGTLSGVSALAGVVENRDGRLLTFVLIADRVGPTEADTDGAQAALDAAASVLAGCGCR
jgi:serine-type D-Ala-D-Ala carboxypeptidase/endopeptidase (penicillin-binding protein 4)